MSWADADAEGRKATEAWRPPPKLTLSQWADESFYLSAESSAQVGRWRTLPYQREVMDAMTDPNVWLVVMQKSARVGWTKMCNALIGFTIDQDPCSMLAVQPTVEDAMGYSKEEIAPMLRDSPRLAKKVLEDAEDMGPRNSGNTILHKRFAGGVLSLVGANSGAGFRRVSRKRVLFDEVDGYPTSAGSDGDPIKLGMKRAEYFWDRKIVAGSTPSTKGASRIEALFKSGDQRRYYVPCPQCDHMDCLVFSKRDGGGHWLAFDTDRPRESAHFVCSKNGCVIEHHQKREMIERGEWRGVKPADGIASFHIWAAYSYSPNATWGQIAEEFMESKGNKETLKTFVNNTLGETWEEVGDVPEWERLYERRELYAVGSLPEPERVEFITCGVDVQADRWIYEVVAWGANKESWSLLAGVVPGDTANMTAWNERLRPLLDREFGGRKIDLMAVDSGFNTQQVYAWCFQFDPGHVVAVKGVTGRHAIVTTPSRITMKGTGRNYRMWPVGIDVVKSELYGWLRLGVPLDGNRHPPGFCHFPQYDDEFFKQLTAEQRVATKGARGFTVLEWQLMAGRQNHHLDARVYARAAAAMLGLDRIVEGDDDQAESEKQAKALVEAHTVKPSTDVDDRPRAAPADEADSRFSRGRARGWLRRK